MYHNWLDLPTDCRDQWCIFSVKVQPSRKQHKTNLDQSIGIDETNTYQLKFVSSIKIVVANGLGGLWALEW